MKFWILKRLDDFDYDQCHSFVICAETEERARKLAEAQETYWNDSDKAWLDSEKSSCQELVPSKEEYILFVDYNGG